MDGESASDCNAVMEDVTAEFATIPLLLEFDVPETVVPINVENNTPVEMEPEPRQEPVAVLAEPSVVTAIATVDAVRLGSGADDNLSTAVADVESENMDQRGRRNRSRGRRSQRSRSRRSRSRSRRNRSRGRRSRGRRSRSSRSRGDDSDFSVHITEDEIPFELVSSTSRGGQKTARLRHRVRKVELARGRRGGKAIRGSRVSDKPTRGRKSTRGRKGRKTAKSVPARSIWSNRLRSNNTNKRSVEVKSAKQNMRRTQLYDT